jgi:hypothetical protein
VSELWKLALAVEHLKFVLRPVSKKPRRRDAGSDKVVAHELTAVQKGRPGSILLDLYRIGKIRRGSWPTSDEEIQKLLDACATVLEGNQKGGEKTLDLRKPVPDWLESSYKHKLKFKNVQTGRSSSTPGDKLGELEDILPGAWRFHYLSPIDKAGVRTTQVRSTAVIFENAISDDRSIGLTLISGRGLWRGEGFLNRHHMYLRLSDANRNETAFFVINKPERPDLKFIGVGAALERANEEERAIGISPVAAVVCFGQKVSNDDRLNPAVLGTIDAARRGNELASTDVDQMREALCAVHTSLDAFAKSFPALNSYIKRAYINGKRGLFEGAWLYLSYTPGARD